MRNYYCKICENISPKACQNDDSGRSTAVFFLNSKKVLKLTHLQDLPNARGTWRLKKL